MIIGLCGLAGSGKSAVAKTLVRHYGYVRRPFAFPLKRMVAALNIDAELLDGPSAVKERPLPELDGKTLRHTLQTLGTEWGRTHMGPDFWVNQWLRTAPNYAFVVADDVRFANEERAVRSLGGIVVRVDRHGAGSKVGAAHASERIDLLKPDYIIVNDGDLADLEDAVAQIMGHAHGRTKAVA